MPHVSGKTLVICPHFDDACYSIGGLLLKNRSEELTILNVFSRSQNAPNSVLLRSLWKATETLNVKFLSALVVEIISKERQKEDQRFCDSLGAIQHVLTFKEAPLRGYAEPCLASANDYGVHEEPIFNAVFGAIERFILSGFYDSILCPLAVGNHVDHLIVLRAFLKILNDRDISAEVFFYEDLPYASAYKLDFINSLARERTGSNTPLLVDITVEMPTKQSLIEIYRSQPISDTKLSVFSHAKRLFASSDMEVDTTGYCERFWRLDSH